MKKRLWCVLCIVTCVLLIPACGQKKESGKEIVVLNLVEPYTTTTRVDIVWYVPHNSDKPERAVQI